MIETAGDDFRLGAVMLDLPYFEGLIGSGVRLMLGRPICLPEIGTSLHSTDPVGLIERILVDADSPSGRALALGAVTHYAADLVFHPAICQMVDDRHAPLEQRDSVHKSIEDQVDLHVSFDLLGHSGIGTHYVTEKLLLVPHPAWAARFCRAAWQSSRVAIHEAKARLYLRRLHLFGLVMRSPRSPFVVCLPDDNPALLEKSLFLSHRALELGAIHLLAAYRVIAGQEPLAHLRQVLGSHALTDGSPTSGAMGSSPGLRPE
jgi:hypothetical protein